MAILAPTGPSSRSGHSLLIVGYLCCYVALDWVSYIYPAAPPLAITPWNPPPGLSVALLLRTNFRNGVWLFVAALGAELVVRGSHLPLPLLLAASALPALAYTALAAVLRGPCRLDSNLETLRDVTVLVSVAAAASAGLALAFVGLFTAAGFSPQASFARNASQYWIGDFIGVIVTAPLLLVVTRPRRARFEGAWPEWIVQFGLVTAVLWVVFGSGWFEEFKLFYLLFLPLIWIAMRHGLLGTAIAVQLIQVGLIVAMRLGGHGSGIVLEFQFLLLAVAITGLLLGALISERRLVAFQLQDKQMQLERSLRLASASEMASALAHELNQPLSAIGSYVRACQLMLDAQKPSCPALSVAMAKVVAEVTRAGDVVRQLREFFRSGSGQSSRAEVKAMLESALEAAGARLDRHHVRRNVDCPPSIPSVLVDPVQVETVLHNLISNAIDALKTVPEARREITLTAALDSPEFVRVSVADSGPGVPGEIVGELFRPFATSKADGMGLGLAICRSLVEARGGRLWLDPREGGSTFSFTLPAAGATA